MSIYYSQGDYMNTLLTVLGLAVILIGAVFIIDALDRPEVIMSWSSRQCLRVINTDGTDGDCNHLPDKYELIWGE